MMSVGYGRISAITKKFKKMMAAIDKGLNEIDQREADLLIQMVQMDSELETLAGHREEAVRLRDQIAPFVRA